MTAYDVTVSGCGDSTRVFAVELDDVEVAAVSRVAGVVNAAARGAGQPTLVVAVSDARPDRGVCSGCLDTFEGADLVTRDRDGEWGHHSCLGGAA